MNSEFEINRYTSLYIKQMNDKDLLYNTGLHTCLCPVAWFLFKDFSLGERPIMGWLLFFLFLKVQCQSWTGIFKKDLNVQPSFLGGPRGPKEGGRLSQSDAVLSEYLLFVEYHSSQLLMFDRSGSSSSFCF